MARLTITVFNEPAEGAVVRFVDEQGNETGTGRYFGWATRNQQERGLTPQSFDMICLGEGQAARNLAVALRGTTPADTSSSGLSTDVLAITVDANGLQKRRVFKFGVVT